MWGRQGNGRVAQGGRVLVFAAVRRVPRQSFHSVGSDEDAPLGADAARLRGKGWLDGLAGVGVG